MMNLTFARRVFLLLAALIPSAFAADALRVMTMNVRFPSPSDGPNVWEQRRDIMVAMIRDQNPDLIGTQELFQIQGDYLVQLLPEYAWFGVSRRGDHTDEHMGIFYRKNRLSLMDSGSFWLSETPEKPASMSWNVSLPRMVTWGDFQDKATGRTFRLYNTHFPHRRQDETARNNCAQLLVERIGQIPAGKTVILTGDFNTDVKSEAHTILTSRLEDAWQEVKNAAGPRGTFHGFTGTPRSEGRIDWILFRGDLRPQTVETITVNHNGRYPSDHFQVLAVFAWK